MSELQAFQDQMTAAILGGDMAQLASECVASHTDAGRRLAIFRNNTFGSLTACLKSVFPVTVKLCDARFFRYAADQFIAKHPPLEARLSRYGAELPRFLASFEPCRKFPVIAEMAALEWAIAKCQNGAEELPLPLSMFDGSPTRSGNTALRLQPNLQFAISRWPLLGAWADHQKENDMVCSPLQRAISRVAICRHGDDIQFLELDKCRFSFWRTLAKGQTLETAARRALAIDPLFDLVREIILLFRFRLVTAVYTTT